LIDLHTHTTASDGRATPADLVARAAAAGVTALAVTDHDTVSGCAEASAACRAASILFVPGIEMTAVRDGGDVHVLGYFIDLNAPAFHEFLTAQRRQRIDRLRQMIDRLLALGIALDGEAILKPALDDATRSAGRPWIARALVAAGYAANTDEAFARWLTPGKPAFVSRRGASPADVIARIHEAGGIASLAHPGLLRHDDWIAELVIDGLDAVEAYHSEHDAAATARYLAIASSMGIAVSGGSDYHGDPSHGAQNPGAVSLPQEAFDALRRRNLPRR
jgi:predicted metal-dependent phosphoesterase TrpH